MRQRMIGMALFLVALGLAASVPQAQATTQIETRYLLNLINWSYDAAAYPFFMGNATDYGGNYITKSGSGVSGLNQFGIRVYRNYYDPTTQTLTEGYEELTSGVTFLFQRSGDSEGYQTATWTSPSWNITRKDTTEIYFYTRFSSVGIWQALLDSSLSLIGYFGTEPFGYDSILNADWNFTLYTYRSNPSGTATARIYFGNSTYDSRISNMQFDNGTTEEAPNMLPVGFLLATLIILPIGILIAKKR